ncbi:hypothetical protein E3H47_04670 [Acinetobacter radioresistens]|uniref:hypothetical protein n=1 Tax=Acinetobacter radioresistens TaxID=40216 RepID=UPI0010CCB2B0|nr:hypothetical protein [Acinetobacter radioresistens]QCS11854.1 hypothetical protein E3H47_04670 [Acinetobacter radioresistens]
MERHTPLLISFVASFVVCFLLYRNFGLIIEFEDGAQNSPYEIAKLITGISGTILGFLLTAVAMLTAVMDRKLVENMRKTGHYKVFIIDCFINIFLFLIVIGLGIICLFFANPYLSYILYGVIFFTSAAILMLIEQGRRFILIFTKI